MVEQMGADEIHLMRDHSELALIPHLGKLHAGNLRFHD